jgi:hypothetical protein
MYLRDKCRPPVVGHPNYLGGRVQRIRGSRPVQTKVRRPFLKQNKAKQNYPHKIRTEVLRAWLKW